MTFDFTFTRNPVAIPTQEDAPEQSPDPAVPVDDLVAQNDGGETSPTDQNELPTAPTGLALVSVALEPQGNFTEDACRGRFEILSRTDNITFGSGSSRLTENSVFLLDSLADIIARCPGMVIEIGGHTDNVGTDAANLRLSDRRAASVVEYLTEKGITQGVLQSRGYGEAKPAFDNGTPEGRQRNRRIEFTVVGS
ncbi:MAG: OmpA family protein [Pseudomonadota bacterium]